jgi:hypothetical protein
MRNAPIRARILQPEMAAKTGHGGGIPVSAPIPVFANIGVRFACRQSCKAARDAFG